MLPAFSKEDIVKATGREELIRKTIDQIIKDFAEFDLNISFSGEVNDFYDHLFAQMLEHITNLLANHQEKLFNLLYRIDVNMNDIDKYEQQMPEVPYNNLLTELILHRELKKVMTREYFRHYSGQK
ncbi:hypothetical protein [Thermophagus xiamenensis]|uniref:Uncharacterized protein n=1 Tax=Thermophagus xiamenensis TaxID=385682 RepID=A0A1I1Y5Z0_9BACT|nr:hypothetical protein [Thermophagus xiamenensis]SFE15027.1 hypothetical protein SAMN05444380_10789 [Thermophagus xiamenensis]